MNIQQKTGQNMKPTRAELLNIWNYSQIGSARDYLNPIVKDLEQECRKSGLIWACFMAFKVGEVSGKRAERARRTRATYFTTPHTSAREGARL